MNLSSSIKPVLYLYHNCSKVCKTLPEDDCVGITYDREPTAFGLRRYQLRYGTELSLLDESRPDVDKFFVKTWVRPPTHTDSFDQGKFSGLSKTFSIYF